MRWWKYAIGPLLVAAYFWAYDHFTTPAAMRAYGWNRAGLEQFAQHPPAFEADDHPHPITDRVLHDAGFTSVRRRGDCICFYHQGFMPVVDSWHEIIYSPKGFRGLPDFRIGPRNTLHRLEPLDGTGRWYYVSHD